jgi:hypothetical protein
VLQRSIVERQSQLVAGLASLKTTAPEVAKYQQALAALLPKKDDLVNFSGWVDGLSRAHNVSKVFSFQGNAIVPGDGQPGFIGFSLDAHGAYGDLVDFLKDVELKAPRYLTALGDFDLRRESPSAFRVSTQGRVFFLPQ